MQYELFFKGALNTSRTMMKCLNVLEWSNQSPYPNLKDFCTPAEHIQLEGAGTIFVEGSALCC